VTLQPRARRFLRPATPQDPSSVQPLPKEWRRQFWRALVFLRPDWVRVAVVVFLTILVGLLGALEPLLLKFIFDALDAVRVQDALVLGIGGLLALFLGRELMGGVSNYVAWRVRLAVHFRLLSATVDRLHSLPLEYHREQSVGQLMTRLDRSISGYIGALHEFAFNLLPALAYLILATVLMARLDWHLALLVLAFAPLPALVGMWAAREQTQRERGLLDRWSRIYGRFNEVLAGIVIVKSFSMEDEEKHRFLGEVRGANEVVAKGVARDTMIGSTRNTLANLARVAALAYGGWLMLQGQTTPGTLVAFLGYVGGLFAPVQGLTGMYQIVRRASVSLETLFGILDAQDKLGDTPDAVEVQRLRGEVEFDRVSFGYRPGPHLLCGISLHVKPGETVAIFGPSGSGKTTLMALLQRLYDPVEGMVRVDGLDIRRIKQRSLRRQMGVVLQEALLFNDTVRNAIAYSRPSATQEEVEAAAVAANAHEFIMRLPQGYETVVGERGSKLSAGERQRIASARALLKDPSIVILDEATSALDAETEALVQEALARLVSGRTTFVIAHRLATVVNADRIVVLLEGRISEEGSHRELMERNGYYTTLVQHQTRGLLPEKNHGPSPAVAAGAPARPTLGLPPKAAHG
jgi:ATP-binding cassette subfamily B protein